MARHKIKAVPSPRTTTLEAKAGKPKKFQEAVQENYANELIFGIVGPVGSGTSEIAKQLAHLLKQVGYETIVLTAREIIQKAAVKHHINIPDKRSIEQAKAFQDAGDSLRKQTEDNSAVAVGFVRQIRASRASSRGIIDQHAVVEPDGKRRAYILDTLRHPHEVLLLRRVYQEAFSLVGVHCQDEVRKDRLKEKKYRDASTDEIERFMERDENAKEGYGQKVANTFHLADYFVDNSVNRFIERPKKEENSKWDVPEQLGRLVDILTHARIVRPNVSETGMFHAYGAKMRSSCLSRQVGAALVDSSGTLVATGTNEVPMAGGGVYGGQSCMSTSPKTDDFRCFVHHKKCSNTDQQNNIIKELFDNIDEFQQINLTEDLRSRIKKTRLGQILEFSRAVHAEMDALISAARTGARTTNTKMFVTTFPCHNCARHIVAAGVEEVQYIEPYLKSQALPLHGDAIVTVVSQWNSPKHAAERESKPSNVLFRPFIGIAPRMYRRAFFKDRDLKNDHSGDLLKSFGPSDGHGFTDPLRVSYAQMEKTLSDKLEV